MKANSGFTLVELLIVMAIAAILAFIAVPNFWQFIQNTRSTTQANELVTAMNLARSEASKRGALVEVCASTDQQNCDGNDWTDGWIVRVLDDPDAVLRVWDPLPDTTQTDQRNGGTDLVFSPRGEANEAWELDLWVEGCAGEHLRRIRVHLAGRPSVARLDCP